MSDIIKNQNLMTVIVYLTQCMAFMSAIALVTALLARSRTTMYFGLVLTAIFSGLCLIGIGVIIKYFVLINVGILVLITVPISYFRQKKIISKELKEEAEEQKVVLKIEPEPIKFKESNHQDFMPK